MSSDRMAELMAALAEYEEADLMAALALLANRKAARESVAEVVPIRPLPTSKGGGDCIVEFVS